MKKKKSDISKCSVESVASGSDSWAALTHRRTKEGERIRKKKKKEIRKDYIDPKEIEYIPRTDDLTNTITTSGKSNEHLLVSGQTTMINMPVKSIEKDSDQRNLSKPTSEISKQIKYLNMNFLQRDFPAKLFPLLENVKAFKTKQKELFSMKFAVLLEAKDQAIYCLKTLKDYFHTTEAEPSRLYCFHWMNLGMMLNGRCLTLNIGFPKTGKGSLSSVLEKNADEKYYLSEMTLKKIFEKKDAHPDIRWKSGIKGEGKIEFPDDPSKPSRTITTAEGSANRMTHGIVVDKKKIRKKEISSAIDANYQKGLDGHAQRTGILIHNIYGGFKEGKPRIFDKHSPTIRTAKGGGHLPSVLQDAQIRRLTPIECERLQGFPDGWTASVSDSQRYKQMGNAVSVPVIKAIGKKILECVE